MGEIVFVGLGLHDNSSISLKGLEEVKGADSVFVELYTSLMPDFSVKGFEKISGKKLQIVSRRNLEEENAAQIMKVAENRKAVLLVPGDPFIATTHVALRIQAKKMGINTRVVHGASALSAVIGLSGLHNYKFGKSVTLPLLDSSETPYETVAQNMRLGLHTLCFLDINVEEDRYMRIPEGLRSLLRTEEKRGEGVFVGDTLVVGIARAGSKNPTIKADFMNNISSYDFGKPPYSMIFPGKLHFMEAEALVCLADAPAIVRRSVV